MDSQGVIRSNRQRVYHRDLLPRALGNREGLEKTEGQVAHRFDLSAGAAVVEVLFDVLPHLGPVELSTFELEGSGSSWVAGGGEVVMKLEDLQFQGSVVRYIVDASEV